MADRWPALMTRETAAEYCDMSADQFDRQCPVQAVDQGWRGLRWKKAKLDAWIEQLPEKPRARKIGLDEPANDGANGRTAGLENPAPAVDAATDAAERKRRSLERIG
ncbi:MAG: hypothetical protein ACK4X1_10280 [Terricaulis sp.]